MRNRVSVFTIIGFILSIVSISFCNFAFFTLFLITSPALVFCIIGNKKSNKAGRVLSTIGIVICAFSFVIGIFGPPFIRRVNNAKGTVAIEYANEGDYDKAYEYLDKITDDKKREYYKNIIEGNIQ